jgi:ATP-dependent Clp endopeptidase proteolytic subunit ClpP
MKIKDTAAQSRLCKKAWLQWDSDKNQKPTKMKTIQIENKSGKVKLNESVTRDSINRMVEEIGRLFGASASASGANFGEIMNFAENAVDVLEIEINSPGGSVFDGYTLYQEIKSLRERGVVVNATVTGMAASMASVLCCACSKVAIVPHGQMMIHEASTMVGGNADKLRKEANFLDSASNNIAGIYAEKTGKPVEDIRAMMKKETWMNAKEAVELGFADEIFDIRSNSPKSQDMKWLNNLFPDKSDEIAKIEAALAESESIRAELESANAAIDSLKETEISNVSRIAELVEINTGLETTKAELEAKVAEITAQLEAKFAEVANQLEAKDEEIKKLSEAGPALVIEALASIGQPEPIEPASASSSSIVAKTRKEFNEMTPANRLAYVKAGGKIK